jgi:hypothetical protein
MGTGTRTTTGVGLLLLLGAPALATEEPAFRLVEKDGAFELREYPALLAAETEVAGVDFDTASDYAFNRLFRYITGENRARTDIAMTAPVIQQATPSRGEEIAMTAPMIQQRDARSDSYRVAFLVPAQYTRETVPEPTDPRVKIVATPARLVAAIRYSGRNPESDYAARESELRAAMAKRGLVAVGDPIAAQYDAPFIPGPFRRNEVLIPVRRD